MYCLGCGSEIAFGAVECPNCHLPAGEPSLEGLRTTSLAGLVRGETITSPAEPEQSLEGSSWADATIGPEPAELKPTHYAAVSASTRINVLARNVPGVKIIVTQVLSRDSKGNVLVRPTPANAGRTAAPGVILTGAKIGAVTGAPLPQTLGAIASHAIAVTTLTFPASVGEPNDDATLTVTGSYVGGTFNSSLEVTIPAFPGGGQ